MFLRQLKTCILIAFFSSILQTSEAIIQGETAKPRQFPYAVALYLNGQFFCSGSLISHDAVLTAAHCIVINGVTQSASVYIGVVGSINRQAKSRVRFSAVVPHPFYDPGRNLNDIAVMRIANPVQFSDNLNAICLAAADSNLNEYEVAVAMGWGDIAIGRPQVFPGELMYVKQDVLTYQLCALKLRDLFGITSGYQTRICTREYKQLVEGICSGDSGGPLVHLPESAGGVPVQIGVASFSGQRCGVLVSASTRVSAYINFIRPIAPDICTK